VGPYSLERLALEIRNLAGLDDDDMELAPAIAMRVLGPDSVVFGLQGTASRLDGLRIFVPPDHPDLNFAVAHELAEWGLRDIARFGGTHASKELAANYVAAALLAPPATVRRAHAHFGERLRPLAKAFGLSQTSAALRLAEVLCDERAIVTRSGNVILRSQGSFPWGDVPIVSVAFGHSRWRGVSRAKLRGGIDEGRVALRAS
jgi:hypothetical protein